MNGWSQYAQNVQNGLAPSRNPSKATFESKPPLPSVFNQDLTARQGVTGSIGLAGAALAVGVLSVALGQAIEEENNKKEAEVSVKLAKCFKIVFPKIQVTYAVSCSATRSGAAIPDVSGQMVTCTFTDTSTNEKDMVIVSGSGTSPKRYKEGTVLIVELVRTYVDATNGASLTEQARKTVTVEKEDLSVALNIVP